jgi:hypothetical protein
MNKDQTKHTWSSVSSILFVYHYSKHSTSTLRELHAHIVRLRLWRHPSRTDPEARSQLLHILPAPRLVPASASKSDNYRQECLHCRSLCLLSGTRLVMFFDVVMHLAWWKITAEERLIAPRSLPTNDTRAAMSSRDSSLPA